MAKNEKKSLETRKHEDNLKFEELGIQDILNDFLATQEAKDEVGNVYDNWLNGLKEFAHKMPEISWAATGEFLEAVKERKQAFVDLSFLYFKRVMGEIMSDKPVEITADFRKLCLEILNGQAQKRCEAVTLAVKADVADVAFVTFKTHEQVEEYNRVLHAEPDSYELVKIGLDRLFNEVRVALGG